MQKPSAQHGFSLIELLVSMAIISTIAVFGFSAYKIAQARNQLIVVRNAIVNDLRRAQMQSEAVANDAQWGVKIQNNSVIVFRGASYAARTVASDETFSLPSGFAYTGITELVYSKFDGTPSTTGTITITGPNNTSAIITINSKGMVSF